MWNKKKQIQTLNCMIVEELEKNRGKKKYNE